MFRCYAGVRRLGDAIGRATYETEERGELQEGQFDLLRHDPLRAYRLLLCQVTRGAQYHYDGIVLELEGSAGTCMSASILQLRGGCGRQTKLKESPTRQQSGLHETLRELHRPTLR